MPEQPGALSAGEVASPGDTSGDAIVGQPIDEIASADGVSRRLRYWLSLPERTLRASAGMAAGVVRESAGLLVPRSFQNSQTYTVLVRQMLDFLAQDVGRVKSSTPQDPARASGEFCGPQGCGQFPGDGLAGHVSPLACDAVGGVQ